MLGPCPLPTDVPVRQQHREMHGATGREARAPAHVHPDARLKTAKRSAAIIHEEEILWAAQDASMNEVHFRHCGIKLHLLEVSKAYVFFSTSSMSFFDDSKTLVFQKNVGKILAKLRFFSFLTPGINFF